MMVPLRNHPRKGADGTVQVLVVVVVVVAVVAVQVGAGTSPGVKRTGRVNRAVPRQEIPGTLLRPLGDGMLVLEQRRPPLQARDGTPHLKLGRVEVQWRAIGGMPHRWVPVVLVVRLGMLHPKLGD